MPNTILQQWLIVTASSLESFDTITAIVANLSFTGGIAMRTISLEAGTERAHPALLALLFNTAGFIPGRTFFHIMN